MIIRQIKSYKEILDVIGKHPISPSCRFIFRGIRNDFRLVPSIHYDNVSKLLNTNEKIAYYENCLINDFYNCLRDNYNITHYDINNFDLWFLARHFGLKSRLIDFTKDITIALQFAFEMSGNFPAILYCLNLDCVPLLQENDIKKLNPFIFYEPSILHPAIKYHEIFNGLGVSRPFIQHSFYFNQPIETLYIPLSEQFNDDCLKIFEIHPDYFESIKRDAEKYTRYVMDKNLLIQKIELDIKCDELNIECLKSILPPSSPTVLSL